MAEPHTLTTASEPRRADGDGGRRRVGRARGLPGGRAVVGALLVAAAAVGVFAAYLNAVGEPDTRYLVARAEVAPGTRLATPDQIGELFELRAMALDEVVAPRAYGGGDLEALVGGLVVVPLEPGDLLLRSGVVSDGGSADAHVLSFAIEPAAAVAGRLRAGERVDVLATYGSGESGWTAFVARGVPVVAVDHPDGGALTARGGLVLTLAVASPEEIQALTHAFNNAAVVVTRTASGAPAPTPPAYQPSPERPVPASGAGGDEDRDG